MLVRKLPVFALIAAPLSGVAISLTLFYGKEDWFGDNFRDVAFFLINAALALLFNWRLLTESAARGKVWGATLLLLALASLCQAYVHHRSQEFIGRAVFDFIPEVLFLLAAQSSVLLLAVFFSRIPRRSTDITLAVCTNLFIFNSLLYAAFVGLTALVFSLGFALLRLVGLDLWQMLGEAGQWAFIGLCGGLNLVILNLAPLPERERPFPYLYIFQYIALAFTLFYLFVLPFSSAGIDSGQRLTIAVVLWLLAIWLYDREAPRLRLNILTALAGITLALLSLRGIFIRIDTYGLTEERGHALLLTALLCIMHGGLLLKFMALYWQRPFAAHTFTATVILLAIAIFSGALLPLSRWALASQVAHYAGGNGNFANFEAEPYYLKSRYGKAGEAAMVEIYRYHGKTPPKEENSEVDRARFRRTLQTYPADFTPDEVVLDSAYILDDRTSTPLLLQIDADHDGATEVIFLQPPKYKGDVCAFRYDTTAKKFIALLPSNHCDAATDPAGLLHEHGLQYARPRYDDIVIGPLRLNLNE